MSTATRLRQVGAGVGAAVFLAANLDAFHLSAFRDVLGQNVSDYVGAHFLRLPLPILTFAAIGIGIGAVKDSMG